MNIVKNIALGLALCAGVFASNAKEMSPGLVINPWPNTEIQTFLQSVTLAYEFKKITIADYDMMVLVTFGDRTYEVYADVYVDPEIAWDMGQTFEDNKWGNCLVVDFSEEAYAAGYPTGPYTIDIPSEMVVDEDGNLNPDQTIEFYKVDTVAPVSVTPSDGMYKANELSNIQISFNEPIRLIEGAGNISVSQKNDWLSDPILVKDYNIGSDGKTLSFNLSSVLPRGYECMVNVPEGFVMVGSTHINKEIWMNYMNWDGMKQATVVSAPANPTSQETMKPFILTWDYQTIHFGKEIPEIKLVRGFPDYGIQDGETIMIPEGYFSLVNVDDKGNVKENPLASEANTLYLDISEFTEDFPGYQYEVTIPYGLVYNEEGLDNPIFTYTFNVHDTWASPTITSSKDMIYVVWPNCSWITYNMEDEDVTLKNSKGDTYTLKFTFGHTVAGEVSLDNETTHGLEIDLSGLNLSNDKYTLVIPQGYVNLDAQGGDYFIINSRVVFVFEYNNGEITAGISQITSNDFESMVFDLKGNKVGKASDMRRLNKGIYIINGKKYYIK